MFLTSPFIDQAITLTICCRCYNRRPVSKKLLVGAATGLAQLGWLSSTRTSATWVRFSGLLLITAVVMGTVNYLLIGKLAGEGGARPLPVPQSWTQSSWKTVFFWVLIVAMATLLWIFLRPT